MIGQPAGSAAGAASVADAKGGAPAGDGPEGPADRPISDEALMGRLAAGEREALEPLYQRHARVIYSLAAQTLGPAAAEEIVQEVFLAVWRKADTFDPRRGTFRAWVLQVAHLRILNELRRRSHRPQLAADPEGLRLAEVPDGDPEPAEATWRAYRRSAVRAAVAALPPAQRRALGLAFFEDLTHEQVAEVLRLPLGTAKTRIRAALLKLRHQLTPVLAALLVAAAVPVGVRVQQEVARAQQYDRALHLVTTSDVVPVRLTPAPGVPEAAHGTYRGRPGAPIAVLTFSNLPPAPAGQAYQAWVHHPDGWTSLGLVRPDAQGSARLIVEGAALAVPPDALQLTLEPAGGRPAPGGPAFVRWPEG
jgi:RNA polymerase sigma-70 factor (ECF subfamily)